jgi:hypothetical protein
MKQPRVPEYHEGEGLGRYMHALILFMKDFTMDVWTAVTALEKRVKELEKG